MRRGSIIAGMLLACATLSAHADASFDGKWLGIAPEAGDCGALLVTLTVTGNMVAGTATGKHGTGTISPTAIAADGTTQVKYGPNMRFQARIRFVGDQFTGTFDSYCGARDVAGTRPK